MSLLDFFSFVCAYDAGGVLRFIVIVSGVDDGVYITYNTYIIYRWNRSSSNRMLKMELLMN